MKLEESGIYPFIRRFPELQKLYRIPGGNVVVSPLNNENDYMWFLVNGKVKVETEGENGKKMLVDMLEEDNYVGHISNLFGQNLYCSSITVITSTFIRIPMKQFKEMIDKDIRFQRHFYQKVTARLYVMYKKDLALHLFSQRELLAEYMIENVVDGVCHIHNVSGICETLRVSRRNFYNLIEKLAKDDLIERLDGGDIYIMDYQRLKKEAQPVIDYFGNAV